MHNRNLVLEKYADISRRGAQAYADGTLDLFKGFSDVLKRRAHVSVTFDSASQAEAKLRVIDSLLEVRGFYGDAAQSAFPFHTTLLEGEMDDEIQEDADNLRAKAVKLLTRIHGKRIVFDRLLADQRSVIMLASTHVPDWIREVREELASFYREFSCRPLPLDNILHSTQLRLRVLDGGEERRYKILGELISRVDQIDRNLSDDPIIATVSQVPHGQTYSFVRGA